MYWTRDRVLLELGRLNGQGEELKTRRLQTRGQGGLVAAAYRLFGSWREALAAAGLRAAPVRRHRHATEDLLAAIVRHAEAGHDVSCASLRQRDPRLVRAVYRDPELGSWTVALERVGLQNRGRRGRWSREAIVEEITRMAARGDDLCARAVRTRNRRLVSAACRPQHFGSWRAALSAAGVEADRWRERRRWSRDRVLKTLKELNALGLPLSTAWLQRNGHSSLVTVARRPSMFGSWRDAVEAAGIDYDQVRRAARSRTAARRSDDA